MIPATPGGASLAARNQQQQQQQQPGTMLLWASTRLLRRQRQQRLVVSISSRSRPGSISFLHRGVARPLSTHPPWLHQVREGSVFVCILLQLIV